MDKEKREAREHKRHARAFKFFRALLTPILKLKFNFTYDVIPKTDGPFFLLINHNLNIDAVLVSLATDEPIYFVASEHMLRGGLGAKLVMRYFRPIIHTKGKTGVKSLSEIMKALKKGYNVALFPEGNRSFNGLTMDIPENTGRIAKKCGASLVTYRMEGGYLTHPRWSTGVRRGKMHGRLINVYSPDALEKMTDEEINEVVATDLYEDAYKTQETWQTEYKGKNLCRGLESTLYMCPECKKIGKLTSDSRFLTCTGCGFKAEFTTRGYLKKENGETYTISDIDREQQELLCRLRDEADEDTVLFEDDITVYSINEKHVPENGITGHIEAYKNRVVFDGKTYTTSDIFGLSITARNILGVHVDGGKRQLEIRCDISFNGLKYMYLYKLNGGK